MHLDVKSFALFSILIRNLELEFSDTFIKRMEMFLTNTEYNLAIKIVYNVCKQLSKLYHENSGYRHWHRT